MECEHGVWRFENRQRLMEIRKVGQKLRKKESREGTEGGRESYM